MDIEFYQVIDIWILTVWAMAIAVGSLGIMSLVGIKSGNAGKESIFPEEVDLLKIFYMIVIIGPVLEEFAFRIVPSMVLDFMGLEGYCWPVGIVLALIFALAHGVQDEDGNMVLPIPQFVFGCFFWYLVRDMGMLACIISHVTVNFFVWVVMIIAQVFGVKSVI